MKTFKIGKQFHCEKLNLVVAIGNQIPSFFPWYHFGHFIDFFSGSGLVVSGMRVLVVPRVGKLRNFWKFLEEER